MSDVRGPFIEYECNHCGATVKENAPRNDERLVNRIADLNNDEDLRNCAECGWVDV